MYKRMVASFISFALLIFMSAIAKAENLPLTLTITSPNGGEIWKRGEIHRITWNSSSSIDKITILYTDGSVEGNIAYNITNIGFYDWEVNASNTQNTAFKIHIIGYETGVDQIQDISDNFFTLKRAGQPLEFSYYAKGKTWLKGDYGPQWFGEDIDSTMDILLFPWSEKGSANATPVASIKKFTKKSPYASWKIPSDIKSGEYLIRVVCISECLSKTPSIENEQPYFIGNKVDLKVNNSDGPVGIEASMPLNLTWTSEGAISCKTGEDENEKLPPNGSKIVILKRPLIYPISIQCKDIAGYSGEYGSNQDQVAITENTKSNPSAIANIEKPSVVPINNPTDSTLLPIKATISTTAEKKVEADNVEEKMRILQEIMKSMNIFKGKISGKMTIATILSLKKLQKKQGLKPTGKVDNAIQLIIQNYKNTHI